MKTMLAKFPGTCKVCNDPIRKGDAINFFGRGHAEHAGCLKSQNPADPQEDRLEQEDLERAAVAKGFPEENDDSPRPNQLRGDRESARRGVSVTRFSSGAVVTRNARGRCEDAPCCGCCD